MAVVEFDPTEFRDSYPKFNETLLTDGQLREAFSVACLMLDNSDRSPVPYDPVKGVMVRKTLLYLLVCHLATLAVWPLGQSGPQSNATQGSVSIGFAIPAWQNAHYFNQTICGQTFWQAVQRFLGGGRYFADHHVHPWG